MRTHREIVVLELRARLLRLANSVEALDDSPGVADLGNGTRQQTNLEKAESMACFVARNYTSRIQVKDIASCVSLHPDYAATLFRKTFGTTLNVLITRHRIAHAQRQLITTTERIVNIAHDSGFDSLSRFNRAFKEIAGVTPRQYRKSMGQVPNRRAGLVAAVRQNSQLPRTKFFEQEETEITERIQCLRSLCFLLFKK